MHVLNKIIHFSKEKICHISLGSLCIPQRYTYVCVYIYIYLCVICLWGNVYNGVRYIMYISLGQISTWVTELLGLADACLVLLPRV